MLFRFVLTAMALSSLVNTSAWAICLPEGCQRVTLEIESCSSARVSNRDQLEKYILDAQLSPELADQWRSRIVEYSGLTLEGRVEEALRIPCVPGNKPEEGFPLQLHKGFAGKFFYLDSVASCQKLDNTLVANFYSDCCDTLPATGTCIIGEILLQPPNRRRKGGGDSSPPPLVQPHAGSDALLPPKDELFGDRRF